MRLISVLIVICMALTSFSQDDDYLIKELKHHKSKVNALAFSPSGQLLATGGEDKTLTILDTKTLEVKYQHNNLYFPLKDVVFFGNTQMFITAGNDIKLIDLNNQTQALFEGNSTHLWSINFAPERNKLTGGSFDSKIKVWDVRTQKIELVLEGHKKSTLPVCFSPDEKYIVSGSRDLTVKVWNALTGELMNSLERHSDNIYDIEFHPNAKYFASASGDKTVRLWNMETGKVVKTYTGHDARIMDIEFSPDGYFLYTASYDGVVMIYEVKTGNKLYSFIAHEGPVNAVEVSLDGKLVATAGDDGKVFLFESAKLIAVDFYYSSELNSELDSNPVFDNKRKGESKEEYVNRKKKAIEVKQEIIDKLFAKFEAQNNNKNIP